MGTLIAPARAIKPSGGGSVNYVADWVMDAVDDLIGHVEADIVVETSIDPTLQSAAEQSLDDVLAQKGDKLNIGEGALVSMTPDGVYDVSDCSRNITGFLQVHVMTARKNNLSAVC